MTIRYTHKHENEGLFIPISTFIFETFIDLAVYAVVTVAIISVFLERLA